MQGIVDMIEVGQQPSHYTILFHPSTLGPPYTDTHPLCLLWGQACPSKLLACIPQVILPLKTALDSREPSIVCGALKILQHLILADAQIGQALVPYYRQLLPSFNLLKNKNDNLGDGTQNGKEG